MGSFGARRFGTGSSDAWDDGVAVCLDANRFPTLHEFLTLSRFDDGSQREPGSLTLFADEGLIKVCLNDKAERAVGFVTFHSFAEVLEGLEAVLRENRVDWRRSKDRGSRRR